MATSLTHSTYLAELTADIRCDRVNTDTWQRLETRLRCAITPERDLLILDPCSMLAIHYPVAQLEEWDGCLELKRFVVAECVPGEWGRLELYWHDVQKLVTRLHALEASGQPLTACTA